MDQFLTEGELNSIKGLIHYLNESCGPLAERVAADVRLIDSNGDSLGRIEWNSHAEAYTFYVGGAS